MTGSNIHNVISETDYQSLRPSRTTTVDNEQKKELLSSVKEPKNFQNKTL